MLTLKDAQDRKQCRICGNKILLKDAPPEIHLDYDWTKSLSTEPIIFAFGTEFAHESCLMTAGKKVRKRNKEPITNPLDQTTNEEVINSTEEESVDEPFEVPADETDTPDTIFPDIETEEPEEDLE